MATHWGHGSDVAINMDWGRSILEFGLAGSYGEQLNGNMLPNYPPLTLMLFGAMAWVFSVLAPGLVMMNEDPLGLIAIKTPAMLFDILPCVLIYILCKKWKLSETVALLTALLCAWHPSSWFNSAIWGQTDGIFTAWLVLAIFLHFRGNDFSAGTAVALAWLSKPQAMIFAPLFLLLVVLQWRRALMSAGGFIVPMGIVAGYFGLSGMFDRLLGVYTGAVDHYPSVTLNAYNFWWLLFADAANDKGDSELLFGVLSYKLAGLLLFLGSSAVVAFRYRKAFFAKVRTSKDEQRILVTFAMVGLFFYYFNTQMHERYYYPFIIFGIPMLLDRQLRWPYILASIATFINAVGVVPLTGIDRGLFGEFPLFDGFAAALTLSAIILLFFILKEPLKTGTVAVMRATPARSSRPSKR